MYKLVIQDDEGKTTVVPLIRDELTIGRKEGNTIRLTERNVSRQHARLTRANGTIVIEDLNSYNGIRVNGSRIQGRATIKEADRVQIGDYLIEVRSDAVTAEGTSPGQDETQPLERVEGSSPPATVPMPAEPPPPIASVAPEPVGLADTDPGRAATGISNHGRLVILSTNFAGQEFLLDKSEMVIGRTDDNEIWLNHRSISRHHAKIHLENGRYSIEDLGSSNGVRVNGEEYGKVELRRADVIDLGHVRLRFIEPGEDFIFGRDAQAVDVTPYSGGRTWIWVGLAAIALIGAIAIFFAMSGGDGTKENTGDGDGTGTGTMAGTGDGTRTMAAVTPDAAPELDIDASVDEDAEKKAKAQEFYEQAKTFLGKDQINEARNAIETAKNLDPDNAAFEELSKQIDSMLDADDAAKALDEKWNRFLTDVNNSGKPASARKVKAAQNGFGGTKYAGQVRAQVRKAKDNYFRGYVRVAVRRAKYCDERDRIARSVVWADLRDDTRRLNCIERPGPGTGTGTGTGPGTGTPPNKQQQYQQEITAGINGSGSISKAFQACNKVRGFTWIKKCLALACRNKNKGRAAAYFSRIKAKETRDNLAMMCMRLGVNLTP